MQVKKDQWTIECPQCKEEARALGLMAGKMHYKCLQCNHKFEYEIEGIVKPPFGGKIR